MDYPNEYSKVQQNFYPIAPGEMSSSNMKSELVEEKRSGPVNKRKPTNVEFLMLFGIAIFVWLVLNFYCIYHGDLSRLDGLKVKDETGQLNEFAKNVKAASGEIYLACSSAVVFSAILIVLFRRFAGTIVWFVVGLMLSSLVLSTIGSWVLYANYNDADVAPAHKRAPAYYSNDDDFESTAYNSNGDDFESTSTTSASSTGIFVLAIISTVFTIVIALIIYAVRKHIRMVIRLFKEAGKVAQSMPLILAQPFVTFVALAITLFLCVYFFLWIESSGLPHKDEFGKVTYQKNELMVFAQFYNFLIVWWIVQFFIACQHMVIAGTTATWYFTRDKTRVTNAIKTSYKYLMKYHLGSVALGSLIVTTIQIIRFLYKATVKKNARNIIGCMLGWLFQYIERFIVFLTKNAYIEIAIYGDGFFVSGKRAFEVLINNAIRITTINSVGDFVMGLGRLLITGLSVLIGFLLLQGKPEVVQSGYPLVVIAVVSFAIVHAFMLAFETIVDSVFICFCEDCDINDGVQRPYYMNKEMMVFMNEERQQKILRVGDAAAE